MNWLKKIAELWARLFTPETAAAIQRGIAASAPYVQDALAVAREIAAATPDRTDDQIVAAIDQFAVPVVWNPAGDRGEALRKIAVSVLNRKYPTAAKSDLNRAVEISVGAL